MTENIKSFSGIKGLMLEGDLLPVSEKSRKKLEFIGDSITCGFGNAAIYQEETGDSRISCFRYPKIYFQDFLGACSHPNIVTQEKMADAIVSYIRILEKQEH